MNSVSHFLSDCQGLEHLAIFTENISEFLDEPLTSDRYDVRVNFSEKLVFPKLKHLVVDLRNETMPSLLVNMFRYINI